MLLVSVPLLSIAAASSLGDTGIVTGCIKHSFRGKFDGDSSISSGFSDIYSHMDDEFGASHEATTPCQFVSPLSVGSPFVDAHLESGISDEAMRLSFSWEDINYSRHYQMDLESLQYYSCSDIGVQSVFATAAFRRDYVDTILKDVSVKGHIDEQHIKLFQAILSNEHFTIEEIQELMIDEMGHGRALVEESINANLAAPEAWSLDADRMHSLMCPGRCRDIVALMSDCDWEPVSLNVDEADSMMRWQFHSDSSPLLQAGEALQGY